MPLVCVGDPAARALSGHAHARKLGVTQLHATPPPQTTTTKPQPVSSAAATIGRGALMMKDVTDFYMYIWKIFYASYLVLPFLR